MAAGNTVDDKRTVGVNVGISFLKSLKATISRYRMYPSENPMVDASIQELYLVVADYLKTYGNFSLYQIQGRIVANGTETIEPEPSIRPFMEDFRRVLNEKEIDGLSFQEGLSSAEVKAMIAILATRRLPGQEKKTVAVLLEEKGVGNIQANQVRMEVGQEREDVLQRIDSIVSGASSGDISAVMGSIHEYYDLIDQCRDQAAREAAQDALAQMLAHLPASTLREIMEQELPPKIENSGLKIRIINSLTQESISSLFSDIMDWYKNISTGAANEMAAIEKLTGLRGFITKILNSPAAREVPFSMFEDLLNVGVIEQIPTWASPDTSVTLAYKADRLSELDSSSFLEPDNMRILPEMILQLCQLDMDEMAIKLLDKMFENTLNGIPRIRKESLKVFEKMLANVYASRKIVIYEVYAAAILNLVEREVVPEVYQELAGVMSGIIKDLANEEKGDVVVKMLRTLRKHRHLVSGDSARNEPTRNDIAERTLAILANDVAELLISDLSSNSDTRKTLAIEIMAQFENLACEPVIKFIEITEDLRIRKLAASLLRSSGQYGKAAIMVSLGHGTSNESLRRILEILDVWDPFDFLAPIAALIQAMEPRNRITLAQLLYRWSLSEGSGETLQMLVTLLEDTDENVANTACWLLGELRRTSVTADILRYLNKANDRRREEACLALGKIGDESSVSHLVKVLGSGSKLFSFSRGASERVRARAAWALRFFKSPEALRAVKTATHDSSKLVSIMSQESLGFINTRVQALNSMHK